MKTLAIGKALGVTAIASLAIAAAAFFAVSPISAGGNISLDVDVSQTTIDPGQPFTVTVTQNNSARTAGLQTDLLFDHTRVKVTDIAYGTDWASANHISGVAPNANEPAAIAAANLDGTLQNVAAFYVPPPTSIDPGPRTFITVAMEALPNGGSSEISLDQVLAYDETGDPSNVTGTSTETIFVSGPISVGGAVETLVGGGDSGMSTLMIGVIAAGALAVLTVGGVGARLVGRRTD